jgi:hypothetical protein
VLLWAVGSSNVLGSCLSVYLQEDWNWSNIAVPANEGSKGFDDDWCWLEALPSIPTNISDF